MKRRQKVIVNKDDVSIFISPQAYKEQLLALIAQAKTRIYLTALYLQDDEAGHEIINALYQAKANNNSLDIKVFVDAHRAQRGLIGEKNQQGNRGFYLDVAKNYSCSINIYGVAVKRKELFGVLHLKGMIFDDILFYTGASINNIYLHQNNQYRLDRYYQISNRELCDSFCQYLHRVFVQSGYSLRLNDEVLPSKQVQKANITKLKALLKKQRYELPSSAAKTDSDSLNLDEIAVLPLVGCGKRNNQLNATIRKTIRTANHSILLFTPYFNLPKVLIRDVARALRRNVKVTLVIGDKKANDFYIPDDQAFSTIGIIPYIYEILLVRFVKRWQKYIDSGQLTIQLWQDKGNSFHLKGLIVDERYHLLTGNNFNPRAWGLDLENGLLLDDAHGLLKNNVEHEVNGIMNNTTLIKHHTELDSITDYPSKPQRLLKRMRMTQIDRIIKRFL